MKRAHYHLNLNLEDPRQRRAWETLQSKKKGERIGFITDAILRGDTDAPWEETLRRILREELAQIEFAAEKPPTPKGDGKNRKQAGIPQSALDFLSSL